MFMDAQDFVANCLLYILAPSGSKVRRPVSYTLLVSLPSEVQHVAYFSFREFEGYHKFVFVLKEYLTAYLSGFTKAQGSMRLTLQKPCLDGIAHIQYQYFGCRIKDRFLSRH